MALMKFKYAYSLIKIVCLLKIYHGCGYPVIVPKVK